MFERAIELEPRSARLRCEAAYVAHKADRIPEARVHAAAAVRALERNPAAAGSRNSTAMCFYNIGLVFEASQRLDQAAAMMRQSLLLRENAEVRARFEAIQSAQAARSAPTRPQRSAIEIAREYFADSLQNDGPASTRLTVMRPRGGPPNPAIEAKIVVGRSAGTVWVLEVRTGSQAIVEALTSQYDGDAGNEFSSGAVERFEWVDAIPGGSSEVLIVTTDEWTDGDLGMCMVSSGSARTAILCATDLGELRCASVNIAQSSSVRTWQPEACDPAELPEVGTKTYEYTLSFDGGRLRLQRQRNSNAPLPAEYAHLASVREWLTDPRFVWPAYPSY